MNAAPKHVANIGGRGVTRRRLGGYAWGAIAAAAFVLLVISGAPRAARLALAVPIGLAAVGFLQAREKT